MKDLTEPRQPPNSAEHAAAAAPDGSRSQQADVLRELSVFHMAHNGFATAEQLSHIALWLDPQNVDNWRVRAHCLARLNRPRDALKLLSQARSSGVHGIRLSDLLSVGLRLAKTGFIDEARRLFSVSR